MLIERRAYTFRPGNLDAFWQAQYTRGFDPATRPIMARVVGYFSSRSGPQDQIVHLWRFDGYEDWFTRLFHKDPAAEPYYKLVRPLMLAQENRFMLPAPVAELTPLWGNGRDWVTGGPAIADLGEYPELIVEETTLLMFPGSMPAYWQACREHGLGAGRLASEHLIGCFYTLVGQQHQVTHYRWHADYAAREAHAAALLKDANWRKFRGLMRPMTVSEEAKLLKPTPLAPMGPLFRYPAAGAAA